MKKLLVALLVAAFAFPAAAFGADTIKIGFNIPLTGDIPKVGEMSKNAAEMLKEKVNKAGGLEVAGKKYMLDFVYVDNEAKAESAVNAALKLIEGEKVLAMVGPQGSGRAIPGGEVANKNKTVMVSGWSTNPKTTLDRPYVFRACFLDDFQGPTAAKFASGELKAKKAAVLFAVDQDYSKGISEFFKKSFEEINGAGSVVSFETFTTKDVDFSAQLTKIIKGKPDVLFVPQYYNEVPLIVKQARELGFKGPILGSDSWGSAELMTLCGDDCKGQYFVTHYAAAGAKGATKEFIDAFNAKYKETPDDVAALTWDAAGLVLAAAQKMGAPSGDLAKDREALRTAMASIRGFDGVTGKMGFDGKTGDPIKCAVIVKINDKGEFTFHESVCP
ncbi:ABC transporter substrate-binding protein [Fundidesulfovibrio putealis]|uniref:ABC transporter substrate-binding protein n=1 Tax=Fundidesulfovibrio putealis TaxID=270496 RepID=UPI0003FEDB26|nr:ABC transporter substrate-binding protein [Fundidesulfovibrio putealis]